jgi:uncharacterized membrane protein
MSILAQAIVLVLGSAGSRSDDIELVRYRVVVLETLGYSHSESFESAHAINEAGDVCGQVASPNYPGDAARWSSTGELTILGHPGSGEASSASDIADDGTIVGYGNNIPLLTPIIWTSQGTVIPQLYPQAMLQGINSKGQMTALVYIGSPFNLTPLAYLLESGQAPKLISSVAVPGRVNDDGQVSGYVYHSSEPNGASAFVWSAEDGMRLLPNPTGYAFAVACTINLDGYAAGWAGDFDTGTSRVVVWRPGGEPLVMPIANVGFNNAYGNGIAEDGRAYGSEQIDTSTNAWTQRGIMYANGRAFDLSSMLAVGIGEQSVIVTSASEANSKGQIAAQGLVGGVRRAIRLDPLRTSSGM